MPQGKALFVPAIMKNRAKRQYFKTNKKEDYLKERLFMVWLVYKHGSANAASDHCLRSHTTIIKWVKRYLKYGKIALYDLPRPGRSPIFNWSEILSKYLDKSPRDFGLKPVGWTPLLLYKKLYEDYQTKFHLSTLYKAYIRHGYTLVYPRPKNYKADKEEQEKFKQQIRELHNNGARIASMDQTTVIMQTGIRRVLVKKGEKPQIPFQRFPSSSEHDPRSVTVFGAIFNDRKKIVIYLTHGTNSDNMKSFLYRIKKEVGTGRTYLTLDGHPAHTSKEVRKRAKKSYGIHFLIQPSHSPELNPTEEIWRQLKNYLKLHIYESVEEIKELILQFFEKKNYELDINYMKYYN